MIVAMLLMVISVLVMSLAALGVLRLPNALARQHAATKAATLALTLLVVGLMLHVYLTGLDWTWIFKLGLLLVLLFVTLPLAAHALGRSATLEDPRFRGKHIG